MTDIIKVMIDIPRNILGALEIPEVALQRRIKELIALELFREEIVSAGKAAELLHIPKMEFIRLLDKHNIDYFRYTAEELVAEVENAQRLLEDHNQ